MASMGALWLKGDPTGYDNCLYKLLSNVAISASARRFFHRLNETSRLDSSRHYQTGYAADAEQQHRSQHHSK